MIRLPDDDFLESGLSTPSSLEPGGDFVYGLAYGVAVFGNDVYVAGTLAPGQYNQISQGLSSNPVYWKNNVAQQLPGPNGWVAGGASAIAVSDSGVYIVGNIDFNDSYGSPALWKNGVLTILGNSPVTTTSIAVSPGGDVYITGNLYVSEGGTFVNTAILWKNGSQSTLGAATYSYANGVFLYTH